MRGSEPFVPAPLKQDVMRLFGEEAVILAPEPSMRPLADSALKQRIVSGAGRPLGFVYWAPATAPEVVADSIARADAARERLGSALGRVIPVPLATGRAEGRTYAILRHYRALPRVPGISRAAMMALGWRASAWRLRASEATRATPTAGELKENYLDPLERIAAGSPLLTPSSPAQAARALERLRAGAWNPLVVVAHYDLWRGNFLIDHRNWNFLIIDWGGSRPRGHPIYDLTRLAQSCGWSTRTLRRRLLDHARVLSCEGIDVRGYLLAALGWLATNLGEFPEHLYLGLSRDCIKTLDSALGPD